MARDECSFRRTGGDAASSRICGRLGGRDRDAELLRGGIKMYEYQPTMMHSKTISVDGMWGTIGSMNFDNRSLAFNNESSVLVLDSAFAAQMDSAFLDDLRYSKQIT